MKRKYKEKPKKQKEIALERIKILFEEAKLAFKEDPALSNRYVHLARKLAMRYKIRIPKEFKRKYCKHCYSYLKPPYNARVRIQNKKVVYTCYNCRKFMRFPLIKKKKS